MGWILLLLKIAFFVYPPLLAIYIISLILSDRKAFDAHDTAILLALFLGSFGAHKFYLGRIKTGVVYLFFSATLIPLLLSLIDMAVLLFMKEEIFYKKYFSAEKEETSQKLTAVQKEAASYFALPQKERAAKAAAPWRRVLARAADVILIFVINIPMLWPACLGVAIFIRITRIPFRGADVTNEIVYTIFLVSYAIIFTIYFYILEGSYNTYGKMLFGIKTYIDSPAIERSRDGSLAQIKMLLACLPVAGHIIRYANKDIAGLRAVVQSPKKASLWLRITLGVVTFTTPALIIFTVLFLISLVAGGIFSSAKNESFPSLAVTPHTEKIHSNENLTRERKLVMLALEDIAARAADAKAKSGRVPSTKELSKNLRFSQEFRKVLKWGAKLISGQEAAFMIYYTSPESKVPAYVIFRNYEPRSYACYVDDMEKHGHKCTPWFMRAKIYEGDFTRDFGSYNK
jgi:TM2 domain-containing membrane protein YozV